MKKTKIIWNILLVFVVLALFLGNFSYAVGTNLNENDDSDNGIYSTAVSFKMSPPENEDLLESYSVLQTRNYAPLTIFPPDDRVRITDTTSFPWRTICKLYTYHPSGSYAEGTAFLVDEFHVLTAGHCVYLHDEDGWPYDSWASSIKIVPGMNSGNEPFGHAWATMARSYAGWVTHHGYQHDWGLITLDSSYWILHWVDGASNSSLLEFYLYKHFKHSWISW